MLRTLKRKFVLMTMTMITLVLVTIFAVQLISTRNQQMSAIRLSLQQAIGVNFGTNSGREQFGRDTRGDIFLNTVSILIDADGNALYTGADFVDISDDDLSSAIDAVLRSEAEEGRISNLSLYFMREKLTCQEFRQRHLFFAMPDGSFDEHPIEPPFDVPDTDVIQPQDKRDFKGGKNLIAFNSQFSALETTLDTYADSDILYKIALVSDNSMHNSIRGLLLTSLLVGLGAIVLLFAICLYLANWAFKPVEATWDQQKRFISDASHELKTPLTVILANLDIMKKHGGETIAQQTRWIDNTEEEALRMKNLVEDLLTLARLDEAGQTAPEIEMAPVNLTDLIWGEVLTFEPIAFEKGLDLESEIAPDIMVCGDASKLKQLIAILIDNACKYAGQNGRIDVVLTAGRDKVRIDVKNTGEPIPSENLSHLFDRFYRADAARTGEKAGYGLGLSIAAGIARHHNGDIMAYSDAENGTRFTVTLPTISAK